MLAVASPPDEPFFAGDQPLEVRAGILNGDPHLDLATISASGDLTIALNGGDDTWSSVQTNPLGLGALHGMQMERLDADVDSDLVVQGPDALFVLNNDGDGNFTLAQTIQATVPGVFAPSDGGRVGLAIAPLNQDFVPDAVAPVPGSDQVLVALGLGNGTLGTPTLYSSGGDEPVAVAVGNLVGNVLPDIAVGHADGTVTYLEGTGDGNFALRGDLTVTGLGSISDLTAEDFDGDGDLDLAVAGGDSVRLLLNDDDAVTDSPITNGDFSAALTGWETEIVGHAAGATPGRVSALGGFAQFRENESFLVSLNQTIEIPPSPETISVDLVSLGLDDPAGGVPDAFEISLLDSSNNSLVPTHRSEATSFFNIDPDGNAATAPGVTFDGTTVTVDISSVPAGSRATLYFDLIGNPPGTSSVVSIDNVTITPDAVFTETFADIALPGPFVDTGAIEHGDVDGDGNLDIVVADRGADELLIFNGDGNGGYTRQALDLSSFGSGPLGVVIAPQSTDAIDDIAVTLIDSDIVLSPSYSDNTPPTILAVDPASVGVVTDPVLQVTVAFSEDVLESSVTNPAAYQLFNSGPNGIFEDGAGDDQLIPLDSVSYDATSFEATVTIAAAALPLVDSDYKFIIEGDDPLLAIKDLFGNKLDGGADFVSTFSLNTAPDVTAAAAISGDEGDSVTISADFSDPGFGDPHTATIDWGDGTVTSAAVSETAGVGSVSGDHVYADNGIYPVTVTVTDSVGNSDSFTTTATVANVAPTASPLSLDDVDEGQVFSFDLATFSDPGFTSASAGTEETFTATIDWGDASPLDSATLTVTPGSPGSATIGTISGTHQYADNGLYMVIVTVEDDELDFGSTSLAITVNNVAPVVISVSDPVGQEGSSVNFDAEFVDAGVLDTHTAIIHWGDGSSSDGAVTTTGGVATVSGTHVYANEGSYPISVEVTDNDGAVGSGSATAAIANVAPALIDVSATSVDEGDYSVLSATIDDPGGLDTFTIEINWADGSEAQTISLPDVPIDTDDVTWDPGTRELAVRRLYADDGNSGAPSNDYTISLNVSDGLDSGSATTTMTVSNVAPQIIDVTSSATFDSKATVGQTITISGSFTDAALGVPTETFSGLVDWNDGTTSPLTVDGNNFTAEHTYTTGGIFDVTVTLADDDTGQAVATSQAVVSGVRLSPAGVLQIIGTPGDDKVDVKIGTDAGTDGNSDGGTDGTKDRMIRVKTEFHQGTDGGSDGGTDGGSDGGTDGKQDFFFDPEEVDSIVMVLCEGDDDAKIHGGSVGGSDGRTDGKSDGGTDGTIDFVIEGIQIPSFVDGGPGKDKIYGGRGHDVIIGGPGDDKIKGHGGRDLIIGGRGEDKLDGHEGEDVIVGGFYTFENDVASLRALLAEWTRTDLDFDARLANLIGGGGLNGDVVLNDSTAFDDFAKNDLEGDGHRDLFFVGSEDKVDDNADEVVITVNPAPGSTRFYVVDAGDDSAYRYRSDGTPVGESPLDSSNPRGATTTAAADTLWVVDKNETVYVYDTETEVLLGSWHAGGLDKPEGIATDATDIWVVDAGSDQVLRYAGGAALLSGDHDPTDSFELDGDNDKPTGITTDGTNIWVVDEKDDRVYIYDTAGTLTGTWDLDGDNKYPAGITIDPGGQPGIWVVDNKEDAIFYYIDPLASGEQSADSTMELPPGNDKAEGIADPTTTTTITVGQVINDSIDLVDDIDNWIFTTTEDKRIYFDVLSGSSSNLQWSLTDDAASEIFNTTYNNRGPITLAAGTYTLSVSGRNGRIGGYSFEMIDVPVNPPTPISIGQSVGGSIDVKTEVDLFTFNLPAADVGKDFFFDAQGGSRFYVFWTLVSPTGTQIFSGGIQDRGPLILNEEGEYTLELDASGEQLRGYQFEIIDVPDPVTQAIEIGEVVGGNIGVAGEKDYYTFDIAPEDVGNDYYFDLTSGSRFYTNWRLLSPSGAQVFFSGIQDRGPLVLSEAGEYTLEFDGIGDATRGYQFRILDLPDSTVEHFEIGEQVNGSISLPGEVDYYTFDATGGVRYYFDVTAGNRFDQDWELRDSSDNVIFSAALDDREGVVLPADGLYTLKIDGVGGSVRSYGFKIHVIPETDVIPISYDQFVQDRIDVPGERNIYTFEGTAGQEIFFDAGAGNRFNLNRSLTSPSGASLFSGGILDVNKFTLTETGTYQLLLDATTSTVTDYSFRIWDSTDLNAVLPLNTEVDEYLKPQKVFTYTFDASAGQELILDVRVNEEVFFNEAAGFTVLSPSGATVLDNVLQDVRFALPAEDGIYTLVVDQNRPNDVDSRGAFNFRLQEVIVPPEGGDKDQDGTDFWFMIPGSTTTQTFTAFVSSEVGAQGILEVPALGYFGTFDVPAGGMTEVAIPAEAVLGRPNEGIQGTSIHLTSTAAVTVQVLQDGVFSSDGFLALPVDALGTEHLVVAQQDGCPSICKQSEFTILAVEDGTNVTITPTIRAGIFQSERQAGVPYTISLDQGQSYRLVGGGLDISINQFRSLTGTEVISDKPIFMLGGNPETRVPHGFAPAADYIMEQVTPLENWGTRFVATPLESRAASTLKVVAAQDGTNVSLNGSLIATLDRGEWIDRVITDAVEITADQPIYLAQLAHSQDSSNPPTDGDPFMMQLPPVEQFRDAYTVTVPDSRFDPNFLSVVAPDNAIGTITLDGVPISPADFISVGTSGYSYASVPAGPGDYRLESNIPFGVAVYGFERYGSYGYTGGTQLTPSGLVSSLSISPAIATLLPNNTHTVTSLVTDDAGNGLEDVLVEFIVSGAHDQRAFVRTDATGAASFSYDGLFFGSDTIIAAVGARQVEAIANWIGGDPSIVVSAPVDGSEVLADSNTLVTGRALPGPTNARIVDVIVTGAGLQPTSVDSIDASGNFFTLIDIKAGANNLTFTAVDEFGQIAGDTLSLTGVIDSGIDTSQLQDATLSGALSYQTTTFNRSSRVVHADVELTNQAANELGPQVLAVYHPFNPLQVDLGNAEGVIDGAPFVTFDSELGGNLAPGATSSGLDLEFANPARERFDFDVQLLVRGNTPPRFVSSPDTGANFGRVYSYVAVAVDDEDNTLTYSLQSAPAGMTVDSSSGLLAWVPTASDSGTHTVELLVSDGLGGVASQSFQLSVTEAPPNRPPVFESIPISTIESGADYDYSAVAADPDGDLLTFSLVGAPLAGLSINSATGQVTFTAPADGNYPITIKADDGNGGSAEQSYTLRVGNAGPANAAPIISGTPSTQATAGSLFLYLPSATDSDGDLLTFSLLDAPSGMILNMLSSEMGSASARIDYVPSELGPQPVLLLVGDGNGGFASQSFTIEVSELPPDQPPVITTSPELIATQDVGYSYDVDAEDPEGTALTYALVNPPSGMTIGTTTGQITWTPSVTDLGVNSITVQASDGVGLVATQTYNLDVRAPNTAPVFTSTPDLEVEVGDIYRYDVVATDTDDDLRYALIAAPALMSIGSTTGRIFWHTNLADVGDHTVTIQATDDRGLTTDQSYTLTVLPDTEAPSVAIQLSSESIQLGDSMDVQVIADDNIEVTSITLTVDGVPTPLDADGRVTLTPSNTSIPRLEATASDASGNIGSNKAAFFVIDSADVTPPLAIIESPVSGDKVEYLTDVIGTVTDTSLASYKIEVAQANTGQWKTIASASLAETGTPIDVTSGLLTVFDPTLLKNNEYQIRLTATDIAGNKSTDTIVVGLEGNAKIGVNQQPVVDLTIPVAGGPPIQIHRQHSQLTADESGDFGNGWSFCTAEPDLRESVAQTPYENLLGQFASLPFTEGDKVYITTPDCQRVGFTFSPTPHTGLWTAVGDNFYDPRWIPDPGVDWQLYGENDYTTITGIDSGVFDLDGLPLPLLRGTSNEYFLAAVNASYNPLGYQLISKQGVRYHYSQESDLLGVTDRNGNTLTYTDESITSSSGQQVQLQRDDQGRLTAVIDPDGNRYDYIYDSDGNLIDVEYPHGLSNSYRYTAQNYLTAVNEDEIEPQSVEVNYEYDVAGRLITFINATGDETSFTYQLAENQQQTFDPLGFPTLDEFDDRGNIVRTVDREGAEMSSEYDSADNLTRYTDARGNSTLYAYDERRNLTEVTDRYGATTQMTYDDLNNMTSISHPLNGLIQLEYDASGNIIRYIDSDLSEQVFEIDEFGRTTELTDKLGRTTSHVYAGTNQPIKIVHPDGTSIAMGYDSRGNVVSMTDEEGKQTLLHRDAGGRLTGTTDALGRTDAILYDGWKMVGQIDNLGNRSDFVLDGAGRILVQYNPDGTARTRSYNSRGEVLSETDENGYVTTFEYSPEGRVIASTDAAGHTTRMAYDVNGNRTSITDALGHVSAFSYDAEDRLIESLDPLGNRTSLSRDLYGRVVQSTDALGFSTGYEYNTLGQIVRTEFADGGVETYTYDLVGNHVTTTDPLGFVTTMIYDSRDRLIETIDARGAKYQRVLDGTGRVIELIDSLGRSTKNTFDDDYRIVTTEDADGNLWQRTYEDDARTIIATDPLGRVSITRHDKMGRAIEMTDALGQVTTFEYDSNGQLIRSVDPKGQVTRNVYDSLGRVVKTIDALANETIYTYDAVGQLVSTMDPSGAVTQFQYDAAGRQIETTLPNGGTNQTRYDAIDRVIAEIDPLGRETTMTYDAMDRMVSYTDSRGSTTSFQYDLNGRRIRSEDPNGSVHQFGYDSVGHQVLETDPYGNSTSRSYDLAGNLVSVTDRLGRRREFNFDNLDRIASEQWYTPDSQPQYEATYSYDSVGNLLTAEDDHSNYQFAYDLLNRIETVDNQGTAGAPHVTFQYRYDSVGNRSSVSDSLGTSLIARYDPRSQLESLAWSNGDADLALIEFDYDSRGFLSSIERRVTATASGPSITTVVEHNSTAVVSKITHLDELDQAIVEYDYARDLADQITSWTHHGKTRTYSYDNAGQLTSTHDPVHGPSQYQYDANGNRSDSTRTIGIGNRLIQDAGFDYSYDDEGNLVSKVDRQSEQIHLYEYDFKNRLVKVEIVEVDATVSYRSEYVYDVFDRRIEVSIDLDGDGGQDSETNRTIYLDQEAWADFDENGVLTARYMTGAGTDDMIARWIPSEGTQWYLNDHLGTVHDVISDSGDFVLSVVYDDFGLPTADLGSIDRYENRFLFTGREYDFGSGLYYYRARYYDPASGVFTSEDSLGYQAGDSNFYRYVGNAPLHGTDPSGHNTIMEKLFLVAAQTSLGFSGGYLVGITHGRLEAWGLGQRANPECYCDATPIDWNRINATGFTYGLFGAAVSFAFGAASQSGITAMVSRGAATNIIAGTVSFTATLSLIGIRDAYAVRDAYPDLYKARLMGLGLDIGLSLVGAFFIRNPGRLAAERLDDLMAADLRYLSRKRQLAYLESRLDKLNAAELAELNRLRKSTLAYEEAADAAIGLKLKTIETSADHVEVGTIHTNMATRQGSLEIQLRGNEAISNLEINAAQVMTHRGYDVILRTPVGTRAAGGTSDLLLNGTRADIFAPTTSNASRVVGAVFKKNSQLPGGGIVVLDLRSTSLTACDFSNIGARLSGAANKAGVQLNIRRVEIIE